MKYRKLRIAWSVICGIAAVLLVALWIKSFVGHGDLLSFDGTKVRSNDGRVVFFTLPNGPGPWKTSEFPTYVAEQNWLGFPVAYGTTRAGPYVTIPHWFVAGLVTLAATIPWIRSIRWRYSLRTLLITMTVAAIGLGLVVYAMRN